MIIRATLPMYNWRPAWTTCVKLLRRPFVRYLGICFLIALGALAGILFQEFAGRAGSRRQLLQRELKTASEFLRFKSMPRIHRTTVTAPTVRQTEAAAQTQGLKRQTPAPATAGKGTSAGSSVRR